MVMEHIIIIMNLMVAKKNILKENSKIINFMVKDSI